MEGSPARRSRDGVRAVAPLAVAVLGFGISFGLLARSAGMGGRVPFGFRVRDKHLEVVPQEARLIRRAASQILSGVTLSSLARDWNARGARTSTGKLWTRYHLGRTLVKDALVPEILTKTDHDRLVDLIDGRRTGERAPMYLLTNIVRCGRCYAPMTGRGGRYICEASGKTHLTVLATKVDEVVTDTASERPEPKVTLAHDPAEPLVRQREDLERALEDLGDSDLDEAVIRGRTRKLRRELNAVDEELDKVRPRAEWSLLYEAIESFDARSWIETLVDHVTVAPAQPGAGRFDPSRITIRWR